MIKNSQNQTGSAHIVIIAILVLVIIAALGFVVWQNFLIPKDTSTTAVTQVGQTQSKNTVAEPKAVVVDENDYMFEVVEGFSESMEQQFTYTGSLKAIKTYINKDGDYFEILSHFGGGGGISGDYFWGYNVQNGNVVLDKTPRCIEDSAFCFANNGSTEGVIGNSPDEYYFAFGNKAQNEIGLDFVDKFISTFKFK